MERGRNVYEASRMNERGGTTGVPEKRLQVELRCGAKSLAHAAERDPVRRNTPAERATRKVSQRSVKERQGRSINERHSEKKGGAPRRRQDARVRRGEDEEGERVPSRRRYWTPFMQ